MTKSNILKVKQYLKERKDNPFSERILQLLEKAPDYAKSAIIEKNINYRILQKIFKGDIIDAERKRH